MEFTGTTRSLLDLTAKLKQKGAICVASGCNNSLARDMENGLLGIRSYYGFPDKDEQRSLWLKVVPPTDWDPNNSTICSDHFVGGRRTEKPGTPGYAPILLSPKGKSKIKPISLDNNRTSNSRCLSGLSNLVTPSLSTPAATEATNRVEEQREFRISGKKFYSGVHCSAPGCKNTSGKDKQLGIKRSYYGFPHKDEKRLKLWLKAIPWDNWMPSIHQRICCVKSNVVGDPGYVPTLFPQLKELRKERASSRKKKSSTTIKNKSTTKYSAIHVSTPPIQIRPNLNPHIGWTPPPEVTLKTTAVTTVAPQIKYIPFQPTSLNSPQSSMGTHCFKTGMNHGNDGAQKVIVVDPQKRIIKQSPVVSQALTFPLQFAVLGKYSPKSQPVLITVPASTALKTCAANTPAQIKEHSSLTEDDILSGLAQPNVEPEDHESEDTMPACSASRDDSILADELLLSGLAQPKVEPLEPLLDDNDLVPVSEDIGSLLSNTPQIQDLVQQEMAPDHISLVSVMSEEGAKLPDNINEIKLERLEDEQSGYSCTVPGCRNNSTDDQVLNVQRDYFTYPIEDPKRLKLWLQVIGRVEWMPAWDNRICSDHFAEGEKTEELGSKGYFPVVSLPVRTSSHTEDGSKQEGIIDFHTSTRIRETCPKTVTSRKRPFSPPYQANSSRQGQYATVKAREPSPVSMFSNLNATMVQSRPKTLTTFSDYSDCSACIQGFDAMGELESHLVLDHLKQKLPNPMQNQNQLQHTPPIRMQVPIEPQTVSNELKCKLCDTVLYHPLLMKCHLEAHERNARSHKKTEPKTVLPPTAQTSLRKQHQKMVSLISKAIANKTQSVKNVTVCTSVKSINQSTSQAHSSSVTDPVYKVVSRSQPNTANASPTAMTKEQLQNLLSMLEGSLKPPDQYQSATKEHNTNKQSVILIKQSPSSSNMSVTPKFAPFTLSSSSTTTKEPSLFMIKQSPISSVTTSAMVKERPSSTVVTSVASQSALTVSTSSASSAKPSAFMIKQSSSSSVATCVAPQSEVTVLSESTSKKTPAIMLIKQTPSDKATSSVVTKSAHTLPSDNACGKRPDVIMLKQNSSTMTTSVTQQPATTVSSKSDSTRNPGVIMIKDSTLLGTTTSVTPQISSTLSPENISMKKRVLILIKQSPSSSVTTSLPTQSTVAVSPGSSSTNIKPVITQTNQSALSNVTMSVAPQSQVIFPSGSSSKKKPGAVMIKQGTSSIVTASGRPQSSVTVPTGSASTIKQMIMMEQSSSASTSAFPQSTVGKIVPGPQKRSSAECRLVHQKSHGTSPLYLILPPAKRKAQSIRDEKSHAFSKAMYIQKSALDRRLAKVLEAKRKQENELIEPGQVVICHTCQSFHSSSSELEAHMRRKHHKGPEGKITCEVCMQEFLSYTNLMDHIHPLCPKAREGLLQCKPCDKSFSTPAELRGHFKTSHPRDQKWCYTCNPPVRLHSTRTLSIHKADLHRNKPTPRLRHLDKPKTVKEQRHQSEVPYQCDVCGRVLKKSLDYIRHMRTHTGEKPFSCLQCPKKFASKSTLAIHLRFHNGIRPFSCDICRKTFLVRGNLRVHEKIHHSGPK